MDYKAKTYEQIVNVIVTIYLIASIIGAIAVIGLFSSHDLPIAFGGGIGLILNGLLVWAAGKLLISISTTVHSNEQKIQAAINIGANNLRNKQ